MDFKPGLPLQLWVGRHASKIGAAIAKAQEFKWDIAGTNILVADNHLFAQGLLGHPDPGRFCQAPSLRIGSQALHLP